MKVLSIIKCIHQNIHKLGTRRGGRSTPLPTRFIPANDWVPLALHNGWASKEVCTVRKNLASTGARTFSPGTGYTIPVAISTYYNMPPAQQPPVGQGLLIVEDLRSHITTQHSRYDSSGQAISPTQRTLPDNGQHS